HRGATRQRAHARAGARDARPHPRRVSAHPDVLGRDRERVEGRGRREAPDPVPCLGAHIPGDQGERDGPARETRALTVQAQGPRGYQRWPLVWFQCPSCGHRAGSAIALLRLPPVRGAVFGFWCERCGSFSALRNPRWWFGLQTVLAFGLSYLILEGVLYAMPQ